jgi:hypothetical protein
MTLPRTGRRALNLIFVALLACAVNLLAAVDFKVQASESRGSPVDVGDPAPDFTLLDAAGRSHTLSKERARRDAVVLIFYRGHW